MLPVVSVVLPCLNEEEALAVCIEKIRNAFLVNGINGEIVLSGQWLNGQIS